jgi:hypothetical protein
MLVVDVHVLLADNVAELDVVAELLSLAVPVAERLSVIEVESEGLGLLLEELVSEDDDEAVDSTDPVLVLVPVLVVVDEPEGVSVRDVVDEKEGV